VLTRSSLTTRGTGLHDAADMSYACAYKPPVQLCAGKYAAVLLLYTLLPLPVVMLQRVIVAFVCACTYIMHMNDTNVTKRK